MNKMLQSLFIFITTLLLFTALVFAWFTLTNQSEVRPVSNEVIRRDINLNIEFGLNGGGFTSFDEPAEINAYLNSRLPGDVINIRVTIVNSNQIGAQDMDVTIELLNVRSSETDDLYNLTDFFFIEDFEVHLSLYQNMAEFDLNNILSTQTIILEQLNEDVLIYQGLPLYNARMSNLFYMVEVAGEMILVNNIPIIETSLSSLQVLVVEFNIGFDPYTPSIGGYQDGELLIDGLYVFLD